MRWKPSLATVVDAQCGKQVEILLRGGRKVRGILKEMEPDMRYRFSIVFAWTHLRVVFI